MLTSMYLVHVQHRLLRSCSKTVLPVTQTDLPCPASCADMLPVQTYGFYYKRRYVPVLLIEEKQLYHTAKC
jgi:hypothetical protein